MKVFLSALCLLALSACSDDPAPCDMPGEVVTVLDRNNPTISPLVDRCENDASDCEALCKEVYEVLNGSAPETLMFEECHLTLAGGPLSIRYVELPECAQEMTE